MYKSIFILFLCSSFALSASNLTNDLDNDLVPNNVDKCPNTPEGVFVTRDGCTKPIHINIYFDHASSYVSDKFKKIIEETAELIHETPGYKIFIFGHTDSVADAKVNMKLSKTRALKVQNILIENKVKKNQITASWYGETMPVSSNITDTGFNNTVKIQLEMEEVVLYDYELSYKFGVKQTNPVSGNGKGGEVKQSESVISWFPETIVPR